MRRAAGIFVTSVIIGFLCLCAAIALVAGIALWRTLYRKTEGAEPFLPKNSGDFPHPAPEEGGFCQQHAPARETPPKRFTQGSPFGVGGFFCLPARETPPKRFTQELLNQLEWRRFEMLVQALFQAEGLIASRIRAGADGGIDLALRETPHGAVIAIVQCKAWKAYPVGVKPIRELFGVMHAENAPRACFFNSGHFTSEARAFANGKPLELIDGKGLLSRLDALEDGRRDAIFAKITAGDHTTPTCPSCDVKMVRRTGRNGEFWGCRSYPRCKQTFRI
ncbi:MAG: restriction endonuclease [Puniceicoccales bacterium]|nr:restriction endonuclease [Puniceicoccales bacterium]